MRVKKTYKTYLFLLILITLVVRLPFLKTLNLGVAPIETFNVARNLAHEGRFTSSIKANFFYQTPILHSAIGEINLVFPVFVAFLIKLGFSCHGIQFINTLLATLILVIIFFIFSCYFGVSIGFWSAILISFNQYFLRMSIIAVDDIFFITIVTLSIFMFLVVRENVYKLIILGCCSGLTFMTRDVGIFLLLSLVIYYILFVKEYKKALLILFVFIIAVLPQFLMIANEKGGMLNWLTTLVFKRYAIQQGLWTGLNLLLPTFNDFISNNINSFIKKNAELFYVYMKGLIDFRYLSFLSLFLLKLKSKHFKNDQVSFIFIFAILNLFVFTTVLNGSDEFHYLLPSFIFLLPFALIALKDSRITFQNVKLRSHSIKISFFSVIVILILSFYLIKLAFSLVNLEKENYFQARFYQPVCEWAKIHSSKDTNYAATIPWVFNFLADRPTIILPYIQSKEELIKFIQKYHVQYLVVDTGFEPYGYHKKFGELFINNIYPRIRQELPELLQLMVNDDYIQDNLQSQILILKINYRSLSCSD